MNTEKPPSCIDCSSHIVIPDPDPDDWFCFDDEATVCTMALNPTRNVDSKYNSDRSEFRVVSRSNRPYETRRFSNVPDWCPRREVK